MPLSYLLDMKNSMLLLLAVIGLYLFPSMALQGIYGPSYGFMNGDNCWLPDGDGGWEAHGNPIYSQPTEPSVEVPIAVRYLPIFLPALLLMMFMFTPLKKYIDPVPQNEVDDTAESDSETDDDSQA